jgi:hypothetical protein
VGDSACTASHSIACSSCHSAPCCGSFAPRRPARDCRPPHSQAPPPVRFVIADVADRNRSTIPPTPAQTARSSLPHSHPPRRAAPVRLR